MPKKTESFNIAWLKSRWMIAAALVSFLGGLVAATPIFEQLRFWAWASDLVAVAEVSYTARISQIRDQKYYVELTIEKCGKDPNCGDDFKRQKQQELFELQLRLKKLEEQQEKIK